MSVATATAAGPWSARQRLFSGLLVVTGALVQLLAWVLVSGRARLSDQLGVMAFGVVGLVVSTLGLAAWVLGGRRAVGLRFRRLLGGAETREPMTSAGAVSDELVGGANLRWYHRSDCPLARGQGWPGASPADHRRAGRSACGVCRP